MKIYARLLTGLLLLVFAVPVTVNAEVIELPSINLEKIEIQNLTQAKNEVSQKSITDFLTYARLEKVKGGGKKAIEESSFQFIQINSGNEYSYIYKNLAGEESVTILESNDSKIVNSVSTGAFSDGIGGRAYMQAANEISCTIKLPLTTTITQGEGYIYGGFVGSSTQSDIGMMYSKAYNVWKPYMKVGSTMGAFLSGYEQVQYLNGYLPGQQIITNIYNNYNSTGRSRMKLQGYAKYATYNGIGSNTYLTTIMETSVIISGVSKTKLLATIAEPSDNATGTFQADFTSISVGGSTPIWGVVDTDYGTVTKGINSLTIKVSK